MTRSELIARIADRNPHLTTKDVEKIVSVIFSEIVATLSRGDRVEFRGFGSFCVRTRLPRLGKNPKTGKEVNVPERRIIHFKTGRELRAKLNPKD